MRLLAREWYHCEDVSQLQQHWSLPGGAGTGDRVGVDGAAAAPGVEDGAGRPDGTRPTGQEAGGDGWRETEDDALAFLFDGATPDLYTDNLVKEWLAESGYDVLNGAIIE